MHAKLREPHISKYWELLEAMGEQCPWREVADEFGDPDDFQERHYKEFITFLPYVQRFLYGEGTGREGLDRLRQIADPSLPPPGHRADAGRARRASTVGGVPESPTSISISSTTSTSSSWRWSSSPTTCHCRWLRKLLFKLGRAYPAFWEADGRGGQCPSRVEWLSATGETLAVSDYDNRRKYLRFVCQHRSPNVAAHWEYLLRPLALYHSDREGVIRYRQIEYHRMPLLAYLSFDDPQALTRGDFARLALVTKAGPSDTLPYSETELTHFEWHYCYDKFWNPADPALTSAICAAATPSWWSARPANASSPTRKPACWASSATSISWST
ncbi:MAG: hypothetical protein MZV65_15110 [Chromatiales bacterium]|nr:hypothetical protein [Chromatiales bacterium]